MRGRLDVIEHDVPIGGTADRDDGAAEASAEGPASGAPEAEARPEAGARHHSDDVLEHAVKRWSCDRAAD